MEKNIEKSIKDWYPHFIEELRAIIVETLFNSRIELIKGKWEIGKLIEENVGNFNRAEIYGEKINEKIAKSLKCSDREIRSCRQFFRVFSEKYKTKDVETVFPHLPEGKNISWRKIVHKYLPSSKEEQKRNEWLRTFDVWNFAFIDERYGVDCPGRIPYQIIANVLHYFTKEGDKVVDPMAGGGTLIDVCKEMKRNFYAYDLVKRREEIQIQDLRKGFKEETQNCDLIFLDPPYWKKKEEAYTKDSISNLEKEEYLTFFKELIPKCKEILKPQGYIAFLMSNYIDYENPQNSIFTADYYRIFIDNKFIPIIEIQCPLSTQQYAGFDVVRAQKEKKILIISRSLYIFKNG